MLAALLLLLSSASVQWTPWSPEVLPRAAREKRLVLIDVEAVWCHWCHVMDQTTYRDPKVVSLLRNHFVSVKVDQDGAPALAKRYEAWGWPATVVLASDGSEIVKLRGYIEPARMARLLRAVVSDPRPGPSIAAEAKVAAGGAPLLSPEQRAELQRRHLDSFDEKLAGFGKRHKLIWAEPIEVDLLAARAGDQAAEARARRTLDAALSLLDPVWGGFYQYSVGDWASPHFEKIMSVQADAIRVYALAYEVWGSPDHLSAARETAGYLLRFLSDPGGGFHGTQDADVSAKVDGHAFYARDEAGRKKLGMPRIDPHLYAREAGQAAEALIQLADASGDDALLERAKAAVRWAARERSVEGGGFRHGEETDQPKAMADTLATARAYLALHASTGEADWLPLAQAAARFIEQRFCSGAHAGCATAEVERGATGVFAQPYLDPTENASVARFANLLFRYTGDSKDRALAERAARLLAAEAVIAKGRALPEALLADAELRGEPAHVTIVANLDDASGRGLLLAARRFPSSYRRIDRWDGKGPLPPNTKVRYPPSDRPTAYACGPTICSAPVTDPKDLPKAIEQVLKVSNPTPAGRSRGTP